MLNCFIGLIIVASIVGLPIILSSIKILNQYEEGIVLRLGKYDRKIGPGINILIPIIDKAVVVDKRIRTVDIPKQEVITKDNVTILVNGVVYYRVKDVEKAILSIKDYNYAVANYAQTALRDVIGGMYLDEILSERDKVAKAIEEIVDRETDDWGIDITSVKMQDIELPAEMKRAMAAEAEAEREKRAIIIKAEGEKIASENLAKAAEILSKIPGGLQLRLYQTVRDISSDPSEKIVIVLPSDITNIIKKTK